MSSQYTTLVEQHTVSPVIVMATNNRAPWWLKKFGPPESPKHVPPFPVAKFCDRRRKPGFSELNDEKANMRWNSILKKRRPATDDAVLQTIADRREDRVLQAVPFGERMHRGWKAC
jgi:hypothetical protein